MKYWTLPLERPIFEIQCCDVYFYTPDLYFPVLQLNTSQIIIFYSSAGACSDDSVAPSSPSASSSSSGSAMADFATLVEITPTIRFDLLLRNSRFSRSSSSTLMLSP